MCGVNIVEVIMVEVGVEVEVDVEVLVVDMKDGKSSIWFLAINYVNLISF